MRWFSRDKEKSTDSFILEEMDTVSMALTNATHLNLEVEIVTYAIQNMKDNPNLTIGEAITMAYFEWAK
jgi:hypothetical protein